MEGGRVEPNEALHKATLFHIPTHRPASAPAGRSPHSHCALIWVLESKCICILEAQLFSVFFTLSSRPTMH